MSAVTEKDFDDDLRKTILDMAEAPGGVSPHGRSFEDNLETLCDRAGFQMDRVIGRGGMGAVVRARDRQLGRMVAIKFLTMREKAFGDMLRSEAARMSRFVHPNVVSVYSFHEVGKVAFFAMEFVDGESLRQRLLNHPGMQLRDILRIILEAARGVAAAHGNGIVHRDIKPDNIMIATDGSVKVTDFGIASTNEPDATDGMIVGTLGYMSPEQARGERASVASDLYSLTATLYYALAGVGPYGKHRDSTVLLALNQAGEVIPLKYAKKGLQKEVCQFVDRGLAANPGGRFVDAKHFIEELQRLLLIIEGGARHSKGATQRRTLLRSLVTPITFAAGLATGAGGMYLWFANQAMSREQLAAEARPLVDRQRAILESRFNAGGGEDAELAILLDDLRKVETDRYWRNTLKVLDSIERYLEGEGIRGVKASP